jgi:hypothetical protein
VFPVRYKHYHSCVLNKRQDDGYVQNFDGYINVPWSEIHRPYPTLCLDISGIHTAGSIPPALCIFAGMVSIFRSAILTPSYSWEQVIYKA